MKTTIITIIVLVLGFIGGYQYFNYTQPKQEGTTVEQVLSHLKKNENKELFECPDGVYFDYGTDILDGKEYGYVGVTCDNGVNNNHKSSYFTIIN